MTAPPVPQPDPAPDDLLTAQTVVAYLADRSVLDRSLLDSSAAGVVPAVEVLGGGVSNVVIAVNAGDGALVVKQSLPRLRVAEDWFAPRDRVLTEAEALRLADRLLPGSVPRVLDSDAARHTLTLQRASSGWRDWKSCLLDGEIDPQVARRLGSVLSLWHAATSGGQGLSARMREREPFDMLRTDPYYRTVARRAPELAEHLQDLIAQMQARRECLVHGDFSPKNVLVGPGGATWVIDFEVAHLGDPSFDVAFLVSHLLMKSVHRPQHVDDYDRCILAFGDGYVDQARADGGQGPSWGHTMRHVGGLLLARVRGKSPAEYLTSQEAERVWALGRDLLTAPPDTLSALLLRRDEVR